MRSKIKILGIAGSLRVSSFNKQLLREAVRLAPENCEIEILDISEVPLYNQDLEDVLPTVVQALKKKIEEVDAILFVTPEYNYSIPGILKNVIDWGSRPYPDNSWNGKPVAVMGASIGGFGTVRAQMALRQCFVFLNMKDVKQPEVFVSKAQDAFDDKGKLKDETTKAKIVELIKALAESVKK